MELPQISGLIEGILAIVAGIIILVKPKILVWVLGIFLIVFGVSAVMATVQCIYTKSLVTVQARQQLVISSVLA
jgi:uncharacterized membrane protein HdeD (DUF308 family)